MSTQSHFPVSLPSFAELLLSVGSPSDSFPCTSSHGSSRGPDNGLKISQGRRRRDKQHTVWERGESYRYATTISMLPDNVLLEIFDLYLEWVSVPVYLKYLPVYLEYFSLGPRIPDALNWHFLVHVCRRWRQVTFASPRRLNLQLLCTGGTPVRKNLGIWPAIPIVVGYCGRAEGITPEDEDNVIAALEHPDRVCDVKLEATGSQIGKIAKAMQEPFPVLTRLILYSTSGNVPVIPSGFLGGSAPCLQEFELYGIPFPALPTLLSLASDLVDLKLCNIPPTGYISPEAMVACLAALPRLKNLTIKFQLVTPRPDRIHTPPVTQTVLPALAQFFFSGVREYLEDFVARVDAPRLDSLRISYWNQVVDFEVPQLSKFIDRSEHLKKRTLSSTRCEATLGSRGVDFSIGSAIHVRIVCQGIDWQIAHITHALGWISPILSGMVHLAIICTSFDSDPDLEIMDDIEWLQLLRLFSSVRTLFVSREIAGHVSLALEDIAGVMVTGVLPALDLLCLQHQPESKFVAARRDSGHPVTIVDVYTRWGLEKCFESYLRNGKFT